MPGVDRELGAKERFEKWFCHRAALMVALTIGTVFLSLLLITFIQKSADSRIAFLEKQLDLANRYVVVFNGVTLTRLEKQPISAEMLRDYVENSVLNYFILDRNDFIAGDGRIPIVSVENPNKFIPALIKALPKVEKLSHFFTPKEKDSAVSFYIFLKYLYGQALSGRLPDTIKITGVKEHSFTFEGNRFSYRGTYGVKIYFVGVDGNLHEGVGKVSFNLKGHFVLPAGKIDSVNPYGMIVDDLQFKYIQVPVNY